jgi:RNA polymerase sigma factor for flagellar operon FliA
MDPEFDWSRRHEPDVKAAICEHFYPMARSLAMKKFKRLNRKVDRDALVSAAGEGLLNAIKTYEPNGSSFRTYCAMRIQYTMKDCMRSLDHLSRLHRKQIKKSAADTLKIQHAVGHAVNDDEFADHTGMLRSPDQNTVALEALETARTRIRRLETDLDRDDALVEAFRSLSIDEQTIMHLYWFKSARMHEIATIMGLSESRVSQMMEAILKNLRKQPERLNETLARS